MLYGKYYLKNTQMYLNSQITVHFGCKYFIKFWFPFNCSLCEFKDILTSKLFINKYFNVRTRMRDVLKWLNKWLFKTNAKHFYKQMSNMYTCKFM